MEGTSKGLKVFRESFERFKSRLRKNQKQTSTWNVTRWSVHDFGKFQALIASIRELMDGLESITSSLGLLAKQQAMLLEEIESISDTESLRLLQIVGSTSSASAVLKVISDRATQRSSQITSGSRSYHTAPTVQSSTKFSGISGTPASSRFRVLSRPTPAPGAPVSNGSQPQHVSHTPLAAEIPQNQRWMAALLAKQPRTDHTPQFAPADLDYGKNLEPIKTKDQQSWNSHSARILAHADSGVSPAQRTFLELRSIMGAGVPFISARPVQDSLERLLASVEGPPGTPYEGGIFWITVNIIPDKPPMLRFQTRIYHPNIDCTGKICADYEAWWNDENLRNYMTGTDVEKYPWFSNRRFNHYSLGALLVAICGLLASPNIDDPLVPEIAEKFVTDYDNYFETARAYNRKYASQDQAPYDDGLVFAGNESAEATVQISSEPKLKESSPSVFGQCSVTRRVDPETETPWRDPVYEKRQAIKVSLLNQTQVSEPVSDIALLACLNGWRRVLEVADISDNTTKALELVDTLMTEIRHLLEEGIATSQWAERCHFLHLKVRKLVFLMNREELLEPEPRGAGFSSTVCHHSRHNKRWAKDCWKKCRLQVSVKSSMAPLRRRGSWAGMVEVEDQFENFCGYLLWKSGAFTDNGDEDQDCLDDAPSPNCRWCRHIRDNRARSRLPHVMQVFSSE